MFTTEQPPLATDKVVYVGDYVAFVVAETLAQAKNAAEDAEHEPPVPHSSGVYDNRLSTPGGHHIGRGL